MTSIKVANRVFVYRWSSRGGADVPMTDILPRDPAAAAIAAHPAP